MAMAPLVQRFQNVAEPELTAPKEVAPGKLKSAQAAYAVPTRDNNQA
eukprot:CAMPEP_0185597130 /NCGR_PEP_ID=MMETSP0434-20130131/81170_1 /TAXON_ID=626734 ORGANISM="Favella taraikaensis, Strain Fe Narragansett Bay" /NCGR_SAMPLE_ID=MMETSP0434 /ASSEMBLY_ACC=CAM_ASM_000379 /LENGTH=46 /DNA_ID= /DNA_START= /DNA_END= /DNA_ORIENTATION=